MDREFYNRDKERFLTFLEHTSQKKKEMEYLENSLKTRHSALAGAQENGQYFHVLDIGPGNGQVSIPLMARIGHYNANVEYDFHEPEVGMAFNFFQNYFDNGFPHQRLNVYDNLGKDSFACSQPNEFDLILASHVFYYIPDWEESLVAVYESLARGGVACVMMTSEQGGIHDLRKEFFSSVGHGEPLSGEKLCRVLDGLGLPYEAETVSSDLDITDCFHRHDHGDNLISFMLRTNFKELNNGLQRRILEYLSGVAEEKPADYEEPTMEQFSLKFLKTKLEVPFEIGCVKEHSELYSGWKYLGLKDMAVWIKRPGQAKRNHQAWFPKTMEEFMEEPGPEDVRELFSKRIFDYVHNSLKEMDLALVNAYSDLLAVDCFLSDEIDRTNEKLDELQKIRNVGELHIASFRELKTEKMDPNDYLALKEQQLAVMRMKYTEYLDDSIDRLWVGLPPSAKKEWNHYKFLCLMFDLYREHEHYKGFFPKGNSLFMNLVEMNPHIGLAKSKKSGPVTVEKN